MPRIDCPECGGVLPLTDDQLGRRIECGRCGKVFVARDDDDDEVDDRDEDDRDRGDRYDPDDLPPIRQTSPAGSRAVAGLVLGIVGLVLSLGGFVICCPYVGAPFAVLGIVFGASGRRSEHRNLAVGGIATGSAAVFITMLASIVLLVILASK